MVNKKPAKPWKEMTFRELTRDALIEHAESLADSDPDKALEALTYLDELLQTEPITDEMKAEKRRELESVIRKADSLLIQTSRFIPKSKLIK